MSWQNTHRSGHSGIYTPKRIYFTLLIVPQASFQVRENYTLLQGFEWDIPGDRQHWNRLRDGLPQLKAIGLDNIWLPPACKGGSPLSNGYDLFDSYDLGEFRQKGSRSTKWGLKEELVQLANAARANDIGLYFDAVFNHRCGGDATEPVLAVVVDPKGEMHAYYHHQCVPCEFSIREMGP